MGDEGGSCSDSPLRVGERDSHSLRRFTADTRDATDDIAAVKGAASGTCLVTLVTPPPLLLLPHYMTYTYTTHIYLIATLITYIHTYTPSYSYSYSYMYTHMLTYHTYSTIASQPRIHWQIPLYQYAYNDLSDV